MFLLDEQYSEGLSIPPPRYDDPYQALLVKGKTPKFRDFGVQVLHPNPKPQTLNPAYKFTGFRVSGLYCRARVRVAKGMERSGWTWRAVEGLPKLNRKPWTLSTKNCALNSSYMLGLFMLHDSVWGGGFLSKSQ